MLLCRVVLCAVQLVEQQIIDNTFSLCFGYPDAGTMLLGEQWL